MQRAQNPPTDAGTDYSQPESESARKRMEIGLSPQRPTASSSSRRPPVSSSLAPRFLWPLVWILFGVFLVSLLLLAARLLGLSTAWTDFRSTIIAWRMLPGIERRFVDDADGVRVAEGYRLLASSDFAEQTALLSGAEAPGRYMIGQSADESGYVMRIWPGNVAWSTMGRVCLAPFQLQASARVAEETPTGYAALLGRYYNDRNFYLFAVDGQGRYRVLAQVDGLWSVVRDWTAADVLQPAGSENILSLADDGALMLFAGNGVPLYDTREALLPAGNTGLAGGAEETIAEIAFDWFRLYDVPCQTP